MLPRGYIVTAQKLLHIIRGLRHKKKSCRNTTVGQPFKSFKYGFTPREQTSDPTKEA